MSDVRCWMSDVGSRLLDVQAVLVCVLLVSMASGCEGDKTTRKSSDDGDVEAGVRTRSLSDPPMSTKPEECERAIRECASGKLEAVEGVVQLPGDLAGLTVDGRMYVTDDLRGRSYMFITWRGKGSNLRGYVYRQTNGNGAIDPDSVSSVTVVGPIITEGGEATGLIGVEIKRTALSGWYEVARYLD